jgi:hypothetical protein
MGCRGFVVVVALAMAVRCAFAQSLHEGRVHIVPTVTVCDIVNNPLQFKGMVVRVRAQVWPMSPGHYGQFWMNQSSAQFDKVCRFLPARYLGATYLAQNAFGTFFGRVIVDSVFSGSAGLVGRGTQMKALFVIEDVSDVSVREEMKELVPTLRLYDSQAGSFIRPE